MVELLTENFTKQRKSLEQLLEHVTSDIHAQALVADFEEVCGKIEERYGTEGLEHYSRVTEAMIPIAGLRPHDLMVLNSFDLTLSDYGEFGIDRMYAILDFVVDLYSRPENNQDQTHFDGRGLDNGFNLFGMYSFFYRRYGEDWFPILKHFARHWDTGHEIEDHKDMIIIEALNDFKKHKLSEKLSMDEWAGYLARVYDEKCITEYHMLSVSRHAVIALKEGRDIKAYEPFMYQLLLDNLLMNNHTDGIVFSEGSEDDKRRYLDYLGVLRVNYGETEPDCNDRWLKETADIVGIEYDEFIRWLDKISESTKMIVREAERLVSEGYEVKEAIMEVNDRFSRLTDYVIAIYPMIVNGIRVDTAYQLMEDLEDEDFRFDKEGGGLCNLREVINADIPYEEKKQLLRGVKEREKYLSYILINDDDPSEELRRKLEFLDQIKGDEEMLVEFNAEDIQPEAWKALAVSYHKNFFRDNCGLDIEYPSNFVVRLLSRTRNPEAREDLLELAAREKEGYEGFVWHFGHEFESRQIRPYTNDIGQNASAVLLTGIFSREDARVKAAGDVYSPDTLKLAREFISKSHMNAEKFYREHEILLRSLVDGEVDVEKAIAAIKMTYLNNGSRGPGKNELKELVDIAEALYQRKEFFDTLTVKMQDGNLYDLGGGNRLLCCAMLSSDAEPREIESMYYGLDRHIALLHVVPSSGGEYLEPIGAGILVNCYNDDGRILLVDSFEGGVLHQQVDQESFPMVARAIYEIARAEDAYVMFNSKVASVTPKRFVKYIEGITGVEKSTVEMHKATDEQVARKKRYLEAFTNDEAFSGAVRGIYVPVQVLGEASR